MEQLLLIIICAFSLVAASFLFQGGRQAKVSGRVWIFGSMAVILIPFGLAWCVSSIGEGEPFAGYMGVAIFSGLGILCTLLANNQWKKDQPGNKKVSKPSDNVTSLGTIVLVALLTLLGAVILPYTIVTNRLATKFNSSEKITTQLQDNVLSDEVLPKFIKKLLRYETYYGEYPAALEQRLIMSMTSGTKDAELVALLNEVAPESHRFDLLDRVVNAVSDWTKNDEPYPELVLDVQPYLEQLKSKPEFVMEWLYNNFTFPNMDSSAVAKVNAGIYSDQVADYMTTPPDSIRAVMISEGAKALKVELQGVVVPEQVIIAEELKEVLPPMEAEKQKSRIAIVWNVMKFAWILPAVLLAAALSLSFLTIPHRWKAAGIVLLTVSLIGIILSNPLQDIDTTMYKLIMDVGEVAPPPALALIDQFLPDILGSARSILTPLYHVMLLIGLGFIAFAYHSKIRVAVRRVRFAGNNQDVPITSPEMQNRQ